MKFKSKPVPVEANKDENGNWIVEFPNGEIHLVEDKFFLLRFDEVKSFTKEERKYAQILAQIGDCE